MSCLDLTYTVTFKTKQVKDERKDQTEAVVLNELTEQQKAANEGECNLALSGVLNELIISIKRLSNK